jgi:hypothetical protein
MGPDGQTYGIGSLLLLVPLLVSGSLGLVWLALLLSEGLPPLTEHLADLAWAYQQVGLAADRK